MIAWEKKNFNRKIDLSCFFDPKIANHILIEDQAFDDYSGTRFSVLHH